MSSRDAFLSGRFYIMLTPLSQVRASVFTQFSDVQNI